VPRAGKSRGYGFTPEITGDRGGFTFLDKAILVKFPHFGGIYEAHPE
jgi:hypothetical protein